MSEAEFREYRATRSEDLAIDILRQLVYEARVEAGLTQTQLAERAGTRQSVVSQIEGGGQIPSVPMLLRIAEAVGRPLEIRLGEAG